MERLQVLDPTAAHHGYARDDGAISYSCGRAVRGGICRAARFPALDGLQISVVPAHDGVWERIWEELHMALRAATARLSPTAAIIDSQSLKAAEKGSREPD